MNTEFIAIIILCLVLAVVLAAYDRLVRKFNAVKSSRDEIEARAREKAVKIIEEARDKAVLILNEVNLEAGVNQQDMEKKLAVVAEKQANVYKDMLQSVTNKIENEAVGEITDFKKNMALEAGEAEKKVAQSIEAGFQEAAKQIQTYKETKINEFDAKSEELVKEFLRLAVGKVISSDEQQRELIRQALEEAKKDNVL